MSVLLVALVLVGTVWFTGIKPFLGEVEHFKYKKALGQGKARKAEKHILKALDYDPHNTAYLLYTSQLYMNALKDFGRARDYIEMAIVDYNGDITRWSIYFIKGLLKFQMGNLFDARAAFEKSLFYNPTFKPAEQKLAEVDKVLKDHDRVLIKLR
jgi:tetratricopeptide (TPR) repeat protein